MSVPSAGFETSMSAIKQLQTCALDRTATGIGRYTDLSPHKCTLTPVVYLYLYAQINWLLGAVLFFEANMLSATKKDFLKHFRKPEIFFSVFVTACHLSLSWARFITSRPSHRVSHFSNINHSIFRFSLYVSFKFPH